jgi:uncharacterized protein YbbC (DUF1343 family)
MRHNRTSPRVLHFSFLIAFVLAIAYLLPDAPASAPEKSSHSAAVHTMTGLEVFESMSSDPLRLKHIGIITNQTGVDPQGRRTIDIFSHRRNSTLVAIFSPEHGIAGHADSAVANTTDAQTGVPIYSLYGESRRPTDAMLKGIDVLVFDLQDAGVRFYTYVTTMAYCMEAAAKHHISFIVFDRPDPLGGEVVEGPVLDRDRLSFTGYFPMPVRYGMTIGELARMFNEENKIGTDLRVFRMRKWSRHETYDQTGLAWIPPSPNLRTIEEALLYPGVEILQAAGISVGRGTDTPFEIIGAPWIHDAELADELNRRRIPGLRFSPMPFTPWEGLYRGQPCAGVRIEITDRAAFSSMRMGLEIADSLHRHYPQDFPLEKINELVGSERTIERLERGDTPAAIVAGWSSDLDKFRAMRAKYLLYH